MPDGIRIFAQTPHLRPNLVNVQLHYRRREKYIFYTFYADETLLLHRIFL